MLNFISSKSRRTLTLLSGAFALSFTAACSDDDGPTEPQPAPGFLGGVTGNREIGVVVNSNEKAIAMFQLGAPTTLVKIPLGTSATVTPVGLSLRGRKAAVPLGNAASVALVNLETATVTRFFTFPNGNTTGSVWANDTTFFAANSSTNKIGRVFINQTGSEISNTVDVGPAPTAMVAAKGRVFAIVGNLVSFVPVGPGLVTAINPTTNTIIGTVQTGGTNPTTAVVGPDSLIYVLNTGDYFTQGSLTIVDPATLTVVTTVQNIGIGAGAINIDAAGIAYISSFDGATTVWNTKTRTFVRGSDNPVCAKLTTGACRGAADAVSSPTSGKLYQAFFGSPTQGRAPYIFVYNPTTFALSDSISVGAGPIQVHIRTF